MRVIDNVLQNWRARMARPWIRRGDRLLDIGCHQGEFLSSLGDHIGPSLGYDPLATRATASTFVCCSKYSANRPVWIRNLLTLS